MAGNLIITNTVTGERIPALFNPSDYAISRGNNFAQAAVPGLEMTILQFVHGQADTLDIELLLDTLERHLDGSRVVNEAQEDVRKLSDAVLKLMAIEPSLHTPPPLIVSWGSLAFPCVLARCQQRFIQFLPDGTPVRARLECSFVEFRNATLERKEVKRETADFTKRREVVEGDTLPGIAAAEYGDPARWRVIARANDIIDPRRLEPGEKLIVPRLPTRLLVDRQVVE